MSEFIVRRLLFAIVVVFGVTLVVFFIVRLAPGDPANMLLPEAAPIDAVERLRHELGLDRPITTQYVLFLSRAIRGDFGKSYLYNAPVASVVWQGLKTTFPLALFASLITVSVGVPLGVIAAVRKNSLWGRLAMFVAVIGQATPVFVLGLILILVFAVHLRWVPTSGSGTWKHLVLPTITLSAYSLALITRLARSATLDELSRDYVRTAHAKGLSSRKVIFKHAVRNTLLPLITVAGIQLGGMLGGTVVTETVFAYPGVGRLAVESISGRDYPMLQYIVLVTSVIYIVVNLGVDILYGVADPRVIYR